MKRPNDLINTPLPQRVLIMYGPPPDCKRFEVERSDSLRKCIRPLSGEIALRALDDDPRVSVLINRSVTKDTLSTPGFPTRRWTVVSSPSLLSRPWWNVSSSFFVVVAVEKWKAGCAFQAQRLFHGHQAAASCSSG
jgi:hypothetical protein